MDSFTMPDTKVTVNQGDRVLLKCHAPNSFPDRYIQWRRKSFGSKNQPATLEILEDSHYTTNAEGNLYFSYTRHTDKGEYFCNVENHHLQKYQSRMVELIVNPGIVFWFFLGSVAVLETVGSGAKPLDLSALDVFYTVFCNFSYFAGFFAYIEDGA